MKNTQIYTFPTHIDHNCVCKFIENFEVESHVKEICFDFNDTEYMHISMVGELAQLKNELEAREIKFIININPVIKDFLTARGWINYFKENIWG